MKSRFLCGFVNFASHVKSDNSHVKSESSHVKSDNSHVKNERMAPDFLLYRINIDKGKNSYSLFLCAAGFENRPTPAVCILRKSAKKMRCSGRSGRRNAE